MATQATCKIGIIGAGISGISSFEALVRAGFTASNITIFERFPDLGGAWSTSRSYEGLATNIPGQIYGFIHRPPYAKECLTAGGLLPVERLREEIYAVAEACGAVERVRTGTEVMELRHNLDAQAKKIGWVIRARKTGSNPPEESEETFDKVVVALGLFNVPVSIRDMLYDVAAFHSRWSQSC